MKSKTLLKVSRKYLPRQFATCLLRKNHSVCFKIYVLYSKHHPACVFVLFLLNENHANLPHHHKILLYSVNFSLPNTTLT